MDRINHSSAEADKFGAGKDGWTNGQVPDPGSGTVPQANWFDGVQEELVGIIESAGLVASAANYTQVKTALDLTYGNVRARGYRLDSGVVRNDSSNLDVSAQDTNPVDAAISGNGSKLYVVGNVTNDAIYQYDLSTPWDVSTGVYDTLFNIGAQGATPNSLKWRDDGMGFFVNEIVTEKIYQYSVTTAWDISTANYASKSFALGTTSIQSIDIGNSGTALIYCDANADEVYQRTLSTAWDISTAGAITTYSGLAAGDGPTGVQWRNDGLQFFVGVTPSTNKYVRSYSLASSWDISTPTLVDTYDINPVLGGSLSDDIHFTPKGLTMLVIDGIDNTINEILTQLVIVGG